MKKNDNIQLMNKQSLARVRIQNNPVINLVLSLEKTILPNSKDYNNYSDDIKNHRKQEFVVVKRDRNRRRI